MPVYRYQAINKEGETVSDRITAVSSIQAKQRLLDASLTVFELSEDVSQDKEKVTKLKHSQKMLWVRQLATLMGAGYNLEKALSSCNRQGQDEVLKQFSQLVYQSVVEGLPFHKVLSDYPKIFDESFCATVKAGESSGHLDLVFERLADHEEESAKMRGYILQALIYPVILIVVSSLLIMYLMTAVIPEVVNVFASSGQDLPDITKILLGVSHFISTYGMFVLVALIIFFVWFKRLISRPAYRMRYHLYLLQMPILGEMLRTYHTANFAATASILLGAGVKLVDALKISTQGISNAFLQHVSDMAHEEIQKGKSLSQSLQHQPLGFPTMFLELVDTGERTGKLTEVLDKSADIYRKQSQAKLNALTNLLGPVMILIMGGLIFAIVLAILLPIFDLNQAIN